MAAPSSTSPAAKARRPCIVLALLAVAWLTGSCSPDRKPTPARNLVILCIDTLRADHVGTYGYERDTTPHIDALADAGTRFEFALAQSNWTVPATASLLTSLYPSQHAAGLEGDVRQLGDAPPNQFSKRVQTLAELLQEGGFRTALFSGNPYLYGRFQDGFELAEVGRHSAGRLTESALAWLRAGAGQPFFLYVQYMDLHQPIEPPEPYFSYFEVPTGGERTAQHKDWSHGRQEDLDDPAFQSFRAHRLALYDGALRYVDAEIGRLVGRLRELGVAESTLLVITSDHGEEFWDHAEIERQLGGDPRGLWGIGHGHSMFQELLRVPLIFHGPGAGRGNRVDCAARHIDVAPTVLETLGQPKPADLRGRSLAPLLAAASRPRPCQPVALAAESPAYGPDSQAVVWGKRKLIVRQDGVELLYDLRRDPGERNDLSTRHPEVVATLRRLLAKELAGGPRGKPESLDFDAETRKQLESLGYIQ